MTTTGYMKRCCGCDKIKPADDFAYNSRTKDGCQTKCRECNSQWHKKWVVGNREEYRRRSRRAKFKRLYRIEGVDKWIDEQLEKQQGICAMPDCDKILSDNGDALCVDHNHATNKLRALLCRECNLALDYYERNKHRHVAFDTYLEENDGN